ncbi:MAG TPA: helix-turn-helix domain-containing protein [Dissulfurispiraceae bacterium]|nr:helix-turn-helix domain-containing protein [Dissulfurispiraceae bacterium]
MEQKKYSIDEIAAMTGLTRRTIRYYVQEGLINPPAGRGRGGFYYDSHLQAVTRIRQLQEQGASLQTIRNMFNFPSSESSVPTAIDERELWSRVQIVKGLELHISKEVGEKEHRKLNELIRLAKLLIKEDSAQ